MTNQANQALLELKKNMEFEVGDKKEYEVEAIMNKMVYSQQANNLMLGLYYFVL